MRSLRAVLAGAVLLAGCSSAAAPPPAPSPPTPSAPPTQSAQPTQPVQPTRSATPLASAISATGAPGTAWVDVRILTSVGGLEDELTASGITAFATGDADLTWQGSAGTSREVTVDGTSALQLEPPDGEWIAVPEGTWIPTLAAGQPLRGLADLQDVRDDGGERLDGIEVTRLIGSLPAAGNLGGLGINELAAKAVESDPGARIDVTVWIDGTGRIVRIMRTIASTTDVQASATTDLREFGVAAQIRDPLTR